MYRYHVMYDVLCHMSWVRFDMERIVDIEREGLPDLLNTQDPDADRRYRVSGS